MISSQRKWKYLSFALIGIIGIGVLTPQASAATKEIHQQIMDALASISEKTDSLPPDPADQSAIEGAIDAQDRIIPIHFEKATVDLADMQVTPLSANAYSGRISATFGAANDVDNDGVLDGNDCTANFVVRADTDSDGLSDLQIFSMAAGGGGLGFIVIPAGVDGLFISTSGVSGLESCEGTVVLMLEETVT